MSLGQNACHRQLRRNYLFWLMFSEDSVCDHLVPCFWAHLEAGHNGGGSMWSKSFFMVDRKVPGQNPAPRTCPVTSFLQRPAFYSHCFPAVAAYYRSIKDWSILRSEPSESSHLWVCELSPVSQACPNPVQLTVQTDHHTLHSASTALDIVWPPSYLLNLLLR